MLSRLIPSTRSFIPRAFSALSSPSLSRSIIRSVAVSPRSFSSIAINTTAPFKVSDDVSEKYNKLALELAYQAEKWDDAKKAAYKAELAQAEKTKDSAAVIAVMQKHIIQRTTFNDIVQKFGGWYPLLGLSTIAAFSKEIFLLNEEVLLATNFLAVVGTLYINYSDVILQQYYDDKAAEKKQQKEVRELHIDSQKALIKAYEKSPLVYTMLKDLKTEYNTLFEKKVKVSFARQRVAAHQSITKKLNDIHARELEEELRLRSYIQKAATQYVLEKYSKLSAAQKNGTTDYAIDRFAGGKTDLKKDVVRQLFLDYFKNKEWEKMAKKH